MLLLIGCYGKRNVIKFAFKNIINNIKLFNIESSLHMIGGRTMKQERVCHVERL